MSIPFPADRIDLVQHLLLAVTVSVGSGYRLTRAEIEDLRTLDEWPLAKIAGVTMYYESKLR